MANGGLVAEQAAFKSVCKGLFGLMAEGETRIEYLATVLSAVTYERVRSYTPEGPLESPEGRFRSVRIPSDLSRALRRDLRPASYHEGAGTWFSARIIVTAEGSATANYNYDQEPEWDAPVDSIAYVTDQEKFPRDEENQPEWLKQKLSEGRERLASR